MILPSHAQVYLASGTTDLRKSINGLSILVEQQMAGNLFSGSLFGFCNRSRTLIKLLYWDQTGFCLWMKRLEKDRFKWPEKDSNTIQLTHRELSWLLDGLDLKQRAHSPLNYRVIS